jgi:hypothetical protein
MMAPHRFVGLCFTFIGIVLVLQCKSAAEVTAPTTAPTPKISPVIDAETAAEQTKFKLLLALGKIGTTKLPKDKHCDFNIGKGKQNVSIGEWIAWNLSFFKTDQSNSITATCKPKKKSFQSCTLNFNADSKGESPWSCGFQFVIDGEFQNVDLSTLECTGTC